MNKLWVFGDSFSEPFSKINKNFWKRPYQQWKGYTPKCYGEVIADTLKLKHTNLAIGGADNYTILDSIIDVLHNINTEDIIIIGWSDISRCRVVNINNTFTTIKARDFESENKSKIKTYSLVDLKNETLIELIINRDNSVYINELNNYIKLINFSFPNNKIIHWSPFFLDTKGLNTTFKPPTIRYESVATETNKFINDYHYSEGGHLEIAKNIINAINNYKTDKFKINLL
jgi:hypothetical protein